MTTGWYIELIDQAVSKRDFVRLTELICSPGLSAEDRDYLAKKILGLLNGEIKAPPHRPPKEKTQSEAKDIAEDVVRLHRYRPEWAKLTAAVKQIAQTRGCSVSKVWGALKEHRTRAVVRFEEFEYDAMLDEAMEAEWGAAVEHLRGEHGDREFSDEEVRDAIYDLHQDYHDFDQ